MNQKNFTCFGHRGAMGYAPENTLASVRKALELGVPWIEVDVYYVDQHIVVFHDDRLERLTNGTGYLHEQSFRQLRALRVNDSEEIIPTLEEVCSLIDKQAKLNIELKGFGTAVPVHNLIKKMLLDGWKMEQFLVSSFNHRELQVMRKLNQEVWIGVLHCSLPVDNARFAKELGAYSIHPSLEFIDKELVDDAHRRGLKVFVYTVNHPDDIYRMRTLGVDGVFSNYPDRVL